MTPRRAVCSTCCQDLPSNDFNTLLQLLAGPKGYVQRWAADEAAATDTAKAADAAVAADRADTAGTADAADAAAKKGAVAAGTVAAAAVLAAPALAGPRLQLHSAALGRSFYDPCFPRAYLHASFCFSVRALRALP